MSGIGDVFWVFLMLTALQPVLRQRMLEAQRVRLLRALERKRRTRVILLVHRQEQMGLLGFPLFRFINIEDSEEVLRAIRMTDRDLPIDIVLHTPGGLVLAADQIARALADHPAKVTALIPHYAMSGGTLIALAADEILMDPHAVLGPVDPQLGGRPAASIVRVAEKKPLEHLDDQTLVEADIGRMAIAQVRRRVTSLLTPKLGTERAEQVAAELTEGRYTHDHPIDVEQARRLGLPVSTDLPEDCHALMALYPQPPNRRPAVEYLPAPYRHEGPRERNTPSST